MQRQPAPLPAPDDRTAWNRLLARFEATEPPIDWKIHRPGIGTYLLGLAVFGPLSLLLAGVSLSAPETLRFDCALVGAIVCGLASTLCLVSARLTRRAFLLLTPEGLLSSPPLGAPVRIDWDAVDSVDLIVRRNPRQTRETFATLEIVHSTPGKESRELRIDGYESHQLRVIVEQIGSYRGER